MATYRTTPVVPADVITYRHAGKLVFVKPAATYEEALDFAQRVFPDELGHVSRDRISFTVLAVMTQGDRSTVRISEYAWAAVVARLLRGEVIEVHLQPETPPESDAPPQYLEPPQTKEAAEFLSRSARSAPPSRTHSKSRNPSPSGRSTNSNDGGRSWIDKILH